MSDRDRLAELLKKGQAEYSERSVAEIKKLLYEKHKYNSKTDKVGNLWDFLTDHLLSNGVIVQRKVKGYSDYIISEFGDVYSLKSHKYLNQEKGKDGYYYVQLCEGGKRKRVAVHRLVAESYIDNPLGFPVVNHKDENRENNEADNLEWCTEKYNSNYGSARIKQAKAVSKAVVCIETGEVFLSQKAAGETKGITHKHICECCKGKKQTCGGCHWRYATREEVETALKELKEK